MVDRLPGLEWASSFSLQFDIHLIAAIVFTTAVTFHITYHLLRREASLLPRKGDLGESWQIIKATFGRGEEPPSGKYLAEQRLVYAFFGGVILLLVGTGFLKAAKNLAGFSLPPSILLTSTMLHNLATMLFLFTLGAHVFALLLKVNRPLLPSMFTGRVGAEYARHRHPHWKAGVTGSGAKSMSDGAEEDADGPAGKNRHAA